MNVVVETLGPCQKKFVIQLSSEEVNKQYRTVLSNLRKDVAIPGFRKGKASIETIKRRFHRQLLDEVKEQLLENSLKDALMEHKIAPIASPTIDVKAIKVAENQPVEYVAEVEYWPPFDVTQYTGVQVARKTTPETTDEQVAQALEALRRQNATNEPVEADHAIAPNDQVTVTYQRTLDGSPYGKPVENVSFWMGVDKVFPELEEHAQGKKKGEHVEFSVTYGEDSPNKELSGKTLMFAVDIVNVEKVILPDLDDEFAKDLEEESLDALKRKIASNIRERVEHDLIADAKNRLLMKIAEAHTFDVPPSLLKEQMKIYPNVEESEVLKMLRAGAVMAKIQEKEQITVPDADLDVEVEKIAMQQRLPVAAMKSYLAENNRLEQLRSNMREARTLDFLYQHAQVAEEA